MDSSFKRYGLSIQVTEKMSLSRQQCSILYLIVVLACECFESKDEIPLIQRLKELKDKPINSKHLEPKRRKPKRRKRKQVLIPKEDSYVVEEPLVFDLDGIEEDVDHDIVPSSNPE